MVCVAVTRGGFGAIFKFESERDAFFHPVVQYGDAIIQGPDDLLKLYNRLEWTRLMSAAGYQNQILQEAMIHLGVTEGRLARAKSAPDIWRLLCERAKDPPNTLGEIVDIVRADRTASDQPKETKRMSEAQTTETTKTPASPRTGNVDPTASINFGVDKEGKPYGAENLPYRADSNRAGRFLKLQPGMTAADAVKAGIPARYLEVMHEKGFIVLNPPPPPRAEAEVENDEEEATA
jgi:hypothetical protein